MDEPMITTQYTSNIEQISRELHPRSYEISNKNDIYNKIFSLCQLLISKPGVHSRNVMKAAGFNYIDNEDTARCNDCGLEVSNWTLDMKPFYIHAERSPTCSFVCSIKSSKQTNVTSEINSFQSILTSSNEERPCKRLKIEITQTKISPPKLSELKIVKEVRERTFSHWPHRTSPSSAHMIEAGFFNCNVGDRVICIYCNIVCQQWLPNVDDPCEIHKILSPKCPYVIGVLLQPQTSSIPILNENLTKSNADSPANNNLVPTEQIVSTTACFPTYKELPKRYASFNTWSNENAPSVDDLVRAGFFYTGSQTITTCFYCNGSLQNWGVNDNPTIEHARWFPHCAYVRQLCGEHEYRKVQEANRRRKEYEERKQAKDESETKSRRLVIADESTLSRYVAARLDLPSSQRMLKQNFKLSIVKRCWEDQLRLKCDDFVTDTDLLIACMILDKQIKCIDGKKENIIIPSVTIQKIREKEQREMKSKPMPINSSNNNDVEMTTPPVSTNSKINANGPPINAQNNNDTKSNNAKKSDDNSSPLNPCALCLTEEKCLASIPCGHVSTCVPCGHSLRSCPICRCEIKGFVRVYL